MLSISVFGSLILCKFLSAILSISTSFLNKSRFLYLHRYIILRLNSYKTYILLVFIRIHLIEAEILNLLLAHEVVLHSALKVVDLELLAALRHQLMLVEAGIVADSMLLALVEVIQGERALVRSSDYCPVAPCSMC